MASASAAALRTGSGCSDRRMADHDGRDGQAPVALLRRLLARTTAASIRWRPMCARRSAAPYRVRRPCEIDGFRLQPRRAGRSAGIRAFPPDAEKYQSQCFGRVQIPQTIAYGDDAIGTPAVPGYRPPWRAPRSCATAARSPGMWRRRGFSRPAGIANKLNRLPADEIAWRPGAGFPAFLLPAAPGGYAAVAGIQARQIAGVA